MLVSCLALFTDMLVYGLAIPVLPLLPASVDAGPAATGALFATYALAMIVTTPLAGRIVDRRGPRGPLLVGLVGLAATTVLFALGTPFALLLLARALQGVAAGMSWVAGLSLIAASTPPATRGQAMGLAMSMVSVGVLVGPPVAGMLVQTFGPSAPFVFGAAVALADGILRLVLVRTSPPSAAEAVGPVTVLRTPGSLSVLTVVTVGAASLAAIEPVLPLHLTQILGLQPGGIGLLFSLAVLTGAIANPAVGAFLARLGGRAPVCTGGVLAATGIAALAVSTQTWHAALALAGIGVSNAFLLVPATTLIGQQGMRTRPPALGASYAAFNLAYATGLFVGPLISGAITGAAGLTTALLALAGAAVLSTVVALPRLPRPAG